VGQVGQVHNFTFSSLSGIEIDISFPLKSEKFPKLITLSMPDSSRPRWPKKTGMEIRGKIIAVSAEV